MRSSVPNFQDTQRVLIVDDSIVMHGMVVGVLASFSNVQYDAVSSAADAMRLLAEKPFALVITDVNMPAINGLELLAFIRKTDKTATLPVMIVSSNGAASDKERAQRLGASDYLVKPFTTEALEGCVRRLLGKQP